MKKITTLLMTCMAAVMATGCCGSNENKTDSSMKEAAQYVKKYTNADFYKDGVFQEDVAKAAYRDMFEHYGYQTTQFHEDLWWVSDFGLGDFENAGMGGIFWHNDPVYSYYAQDIYLLPGQMIPEHKHVATEFPAKMESWMVRSGWVYNFTEVGEPTADAPQVPASQEPYIISKTFVKQDANGIIHLADAGIETWHFLLAGPQGAIVHEYATYHDGAGIRFSNPKASM